MRPLYRRSLVGLGAVLAWLAGYGVGEITGLGPMVAWLCVVMVSMLPKSDLLTCVWVAVAWLTFDLLAWSGGFIFYHDAPPFGTVSFLLVIASRTATVAAGGAIGVMIRAAWDRHQRTAKQQ